MAGIFSKPKLPDTPTPAAPPTSADAGISAPPNESAGYSSLVSTGPSGLKRKAKTSKSSLIGGA